jgi:hypothetical protein
VIPWFGPNFLKNFAGPSGPKAIFSEPRRSVKRPGDVPSPVPNELVRAGQKVAIGLTGEPVPPMIGSGATVSRNS